MSIMFLKIRSVSRGRGGSAVAKAAYIARDRLKDAASGRVHDYRRTIGLEHAEIMLPAGTAAGSEWARARATLWNGAEAAERPRNARVAREYTVALPHELTREARIVLAKEFAQSIADRYGTAVDLAVHRPSGRGDPRNHHAHILATTRELTADGLGRKAAIELASWQRRERGLQHVMFEYRALREHWAELANEKLREANVAARLEPRSRATLAREATPVAAAGPPRPQPRAITIDSAQQRAVEQWLAYRAAKGSGAEQAPERERSHEHGLEAGLEL